MATQPYFNRAGVRLPGVTTVLGGFKDPGALMYWSWMEGKAGRDFRETRDKAADSGTIAHAMVEAHIRQKDYTPPANASQEVLRRAKTAFEAFLEWAGGSKLTATETELPLVSETHQFGGCLDAMFINGKLALGDFKTGKAIYPDTWSQLAGYGLLWRENFPDRPIEGGFHILHFPQNEEGFAHHWQGADSAKMQAAERFFLAARQGYAARRILEGKE